MVQRLSDELGEDVLIVALNLRLGSSGQDSKSVEKFRNAFDTVYWYQVGPHPRYCPALLCLVCLPLRCACFDRSCGLCVRI